MAQMHRFSIVVVVVGLSGCGGKPDCDAYAKQQLGDKTYKLDLAALAGSLTELSGGMQFLKAPIVIDPGLTTEAKQSLECTVRFTAGKDQPDVMKMQFIW